MRWSDSHISLTENQLGQYWLARTSDSRRGSPRQPRSRTPATALIYGIGTVASRVLAIAVTETAWFALSAFVGLGVASSVINVTVITTFQETSPEAIRGRVMSLVTALGTAAAPLGMAAGGRIGEAWRGALSVVFGACGLGIAFLVALARHGVTSRDPENPVCSQSS
jgi:MFS family permease